MFKASLATLALNLIAVSAFADVAIECRRDAASSNSSVNVYQIGNETSFADTGNPLYATSRLVTPAVQSADELEVRVPYGSDLTIIYSFMGLRECATSQGATTTLEVYLQGTLGAPERQESLFCDCLAD